MPRYSVQSIYQMLVEKQTKVQWDKYVRNIFIILKHRLFDWLVTRSRLQTTGILYVIDAYERPLCQIYGEEAEIHEHLFLKCMFN